MEKELDKTLLELKRAHELERRNAILVNMLQIMPNKGATERSIKEQEMQQLSAEELEHIR